MTVELSIVIVNFNTASRLEACLQALSAPPPRTRCEIVVVDNASTDDSLVRLRDHWPAVRVVALEQNVGFARGTNIGIRSSTAPLLLLLNSDTEPRAGAIDQLVGTIRSAPDIGIVGPRLVDGAGRVEISWGRMIGPFTELRQKALGRLHRRGVPGITRYVERLARRARAVDWVSGACLLVSRAAAVAAGLLDERFFMYAEDVDFCWAVRCQDLRVCFDPAAEVVHHRGSARRTHVAATEAAYRRSQLAFYAKHHPRWAGILAWYLAVRGRHPDAVRSPRERG